MVNVRVGNDDLLYGQVVPFQDGKNRVDVCARINDRSPQGSLVRKNAAVTGERADGKNLVNHRQKSGEECRADSKRDPLPERRGRTANLDVSPLDSVRSEERRVGKEGR